MGNATGLVPPAIGPLPKPEPATWRAVWQPIDTAPVPPEAELKHGIWRCLLQNKHGAVVAGFAAYAFVQGFRDRKRVQWYAGNEYGYRMKTFPRPTHWMPLPPPFKE